MSIFSDAEASLLSFAHRAQDTIGDVIFSFTGYMTTDLMNQIIFYGLGVFVLFLLWKLISPPESVYRYDTHH